MRVQVGNQCLTQEAANNFLFSQLPPHLTDNGAIIPVFSGGTWSFNGQPLNAVLPACDIAQNFAQGHIMGWALVSVIALAWGFRQIQRLL